MYLFVFVFDFQGPKLWDYDMRSTRSNSMSSNSSLESQDSAYRTISNPSTPRSGVYEARSPYNGNDTYSRHMPPVKENGVEMAARPEHQKYLPTGFGPHPPKSMYMSQSMSMNPRLSLIAERPGSDDHSSKGSSRCSSPSDVRATAQAESHHNDRRHAYMSRREQLVQNHTSDRADMDRLSSSIHVENGKRPYMRGPGSIEHHSDVDGMPANHLTKDSASTEKNAKVSSPSPYTKPAGTLYEGDNCEAACRRRCPVKSVSGGSPAMRHPELLSRLQSVPVTGLPFLPRPSPRPSTSPHADHSPPRHHATDGDNHQNALSTLKDKILQRIDSQEEDADTGEDVMARRAKETDWDGEDPISPGQVKLGAEGPSAIEMMSMMENPLAPHPAYLPMPYPHTAMHPAIMYRYNQLAMQQFHALQQLHAHQTAQSQIHVNGGLPSEGGHRPSATDSIIR